MEKKSYANLKTPIGDAKVSADSHSQYIQKKVPTNKKYDGVQSRIKTGTTAKDVSVVSKFFE